MSRPESVRWRYLSGFFGALGQVETDVIDRGVCGTLDDVTVFVNVEIEVTISMFFRSVF